MEQKKDPAFLFYGKDFLVLVSDLTMEERGQFITLLSIQHQRGHLSDKVIGINVGTAGADLMAKFSRDSAGLWYSEWLEGLINDRKAFTDSQREKALKQWEKRRGNIVTDAPAQAVAQPVQMPPVNAIVNVNAVVNESVKKKPARARKAKAAIEDKVWPTFDNFWDAGLAKVGRDIAMRHWFNLKQDEKVAAMEFIPKYLQSNDLQYLKRPPAFINQKTWNDEIIERTTAKRIAGAAGKNTNSASIISPQEYGANF